MRLSPLSIFFLCLLAGLVAAWSKEDHEIFRLKDEVEAAEGSDVTFYEFVGIKPSASQEEINKAYRKKSRQIHPDKAKQAFIASRSKPPPKKSGSKPAVHVNKPPSQREIQRAVKQAGERFARLGVVTNILRGPDRERYDHFLKNGFPKWRGTGYYYTRYRPGLGTVLLGLFVVGGGLAHYGALRLSWSRQREFVGRYIREARKAAWGDETGIRGLAGLGEPTTAAAAAASTSLSDADAPAMNRKQKRQLERENKKDKKGPRGAAGGRSGTQTPVEGAGGGTSTPLGEKRRVTAENGKILIVDSSGNVFLEEEDEDGNVKLFLLDVDEIPLPTWKDTAVYRLPVWAFRKVAGLFGRKDVAAAAEAEEGEDDEVKAEVQITVDEASPLSPPPMTKEDDDSSYEFVGNSDSMSASASADMLGGNGNGKARKRGKKGGKK
ncbi:MAG: hypothetical protein Q9160_002610 [Pyrenula sp. 1 TL-2023]